MVTTGSKFPSLYDSVRQIPQRHDTNLCPAPLMRLFSEIGGATLERAGSKH